MVLHFLVVLISALDFSRVLLLWSIRPIECLWLHPWWRIQRCLEACICKCSRWTGHFHTCLPVPGAASLEYHLDSVCSGLLMNWCLACSFDSWESPYSFALSRSEIFSTRSHYWQLHKSMAWNLQEAPPSLERWRCRWCRTDLYCKLMFSDHCNRWTFLAADSHLHTLGCLLCQS